MAVFVAFRGEGVRAVLPEGEVVVGVDEPGGDDAIGTRDDRGTTRTHRAVTADTLDRALGIDEHLATAEYLSRRQDVSRDEQGGAPRSDTAHPGRERRERITRASGDPRTHGSPTVTSITTWSVRWDRDVATVGGRRAVSLVVGERDVAVGGGGGIGPVGRRGAVARIDGCRPRRVARTCDVEHEQDDEDQAKSHRANET